MALFIEDTIFDFYGIIGMQYEVSIDKLKGDLQWQAEKIKMSAEITKKHTFSTQPEVPLSFEKAKLLNMKI